jgi:predicted O-methyltransferase YrrM
MSLSALGGLPALRARRARRVLEANVLEVRDAGCLARALSWTREPLLDDPSLHAFEHLGDLNERRLRDAEVLAGACANGDPKVLLEIGTAHGRTTALMARNAPAGVVHTVNIPPGEIAAGGQMTTFAPSVSEIGRVWREAGLTNVRQILANTARWEPDFGPIDVAFVDGCHDADFVYRDTRKVLARCRPGSLVLWHDFAPALAPVYPWIAEVCRGVGMLLLDGLVRDKILHLRDSWVGLYRVPPS